MPSCDLCNNDVRYYLQYTCTISRESLRRYSAIYQLGACQDLLVMSFIMSDPAWYFSTPSWSLSVYTPLLYLCRTEVILRRSVAFRRTLCPHFPTTTSHLLMWWSSKMSQMKLLPRWPPLSSTWILWVFQQLYPAQWFTWPLIYVWWSFVVKICSVCIRHWILIWLVACWSWCPCMLPSWSSWDRLKIEELSQVQAKKFCS